MSDDHTETITFEGQVSARDGRPFVKMTCALANGEPVFSTQLRPALATALGLRAAQASIEAERDAGLIAYLRSAGVDDEQSIGVFLVGMREHRQQFDAEIGSTRPLSGDDPSEVTG